MIVFTYVFTAISDGDIVVRANGVIVIIDFQGMGSTGDSWTIKTLTYSPENNTRMTPKGDIYGFGKVLEKYLFKNYIKH